MFFKTYKPNLRIVVKDLKTGSVKFDISDDVVSLSTNKGYGRGSGSWQLLLTWKLINGQRYDELIQPDDLITIELDSGAGEGLKPVMIGLVDRVSRTFNAQGDNPQRYVKVSGQDMGKLLVRSDIGWDISGAQLQTDSKVPDQTKLEILEQGEDGQVTTYMQNYLSRVTLQTGTAEDLIRQLMVIFAGQIHSNAIGYFNYVSTTDDDFEIWDGSMQYIRGTSVWDAMGCYDHRPWNMLCADTKDLTEFQILLERNPIDKNGMLIRTDDRIHTITDDEIVSEDVGVSDGERVNLLCYWPQLYKVAAGQVVDIVMAHPDLTWFDEVEIQQHGYCPQIVKDDFSVQNVTTPIDVGAVDKSISECVKRAEIFWNWYSLNAELESGTFVIHGDPKMKTGDVLLVKQGTTDIFMEYLIEQVLHNYSVWPQVSFTTTLQVTRGQIGTGRGSE